MPCKLPGGAMFLKSLYVVFGLLLLWREVSAQESPSTRSSSSPPRPGTLGSSAAVGASTETMPPSEPGETPNESTKRETMATVNTGLTSASQSSTSSPQTTTAKQSTTSTTGFSTKVNSSSGQQTILTMTTGTLPPNNTKTTTTATTATKPTPAGTDTTTVTVTGTGITTNTTTNVTTNTTTNVTTKTTTSVTTNTATDVTKNTTTDATTNTTTDVATNTTTGVTTNTTTGVTTNTATNATTSRKTDVITNTTMINTPTPTTTPKPPARTGSATESTIFTMVTSETQSTTNDTVAEEPDPAVIIGVAAGSSAGALAILIVIFIIIWFVTRPRRRRRKHGSQMNGVSHLANPNVDIAAKGSHQLPSPASNKGQTVRKDDGNLGVTSTPGVRNSGSFQKTSAPTTAADHGDGKAARKRRDSDVSVSAFFFTGIPAPAVESDKDNQPDEKTLSVAHPNVAYVQGKDSGRKPNVDNNSVENIEELYANRFIPENKKRSKELMATKGSGQPKFGLQTSNSEIPSVPTAADSLGLDDWFANTRIYEDERRDGINKPQARVEPRTRSRAPVDHYLERTNKPLDHHRSVSSSNDQRVPVNAAINKAVKDSRKRAAYESPLLNMHPNDRGVRRHSLDKGHSLLDARNNFGDYPRGNSRSGYAYPGGNSPVYSNHRSEPSALNHRHQVRKTVEDPYQRGGPNYRDRRPSTDSTNTQGSYVHVYQPGSHGNVHDRRNHQGHGNGRHIRREGFYPEIHQRRSDYVRSPHDAHLSPGQYAHGRDFASNDYSRLPRAKNYDDFPQRSPPIERHYVNDNRSRHDASGHAYSNSGAGFKYDNFHRRNSQNFAPPHGDDQYFDNRFINPYRW